MGSEEPGGKLHGYRGAVEEKNQAAQVSLFMAVGMFSRLHSVIVLKPPLLHNARSVISSTV